MGRNRHVVTAVLVGAAALLAATLAMPAAADTTPPNVTITSGPSDGGYTKDPTPTFRFKSPVEGTTFTCFVGRQGGQACTSPFTTPRFSDGKHAFGVSGTAPDGSELEGETDFFTVDTKPPVVRIMGHRQIETTNPTASATFKLTGGHWVGFSCRLDRSAPTNCKPSYTTPELEPGDHELRASVFDEADNRGTNVAKFRIIRIGK